VIQRRDDGKVKITKQHETSTRVGGALGAGVGLATGLVIALFPIAGLGLAVATTAGGAVLGAVAGHAAAGMSRSDLKDLGEYLDTGQAGLVVVAVADMGPRSSRPWATPRRWRPGSSRPTPPRSRPTPRPPAVPKRELIAWHSALGACGTLG
jgi:hypothetical protein